MISGGRLPGVVRSTTQNKIGTGAPRTVESIFKLEHYLVKFYDEMGDGHLDVLLKVGNEFFASPHGEEWCSQLGPALTWLKNEVGRRVAAKENEPAAASVVPEKDAVTISPGSVQDRLVKETKQYVESQAER
jgi:hypothetical protein